jgi:hypothetical protein
MILRKIICCVSLLLIFSVLFGRPYFQPSQAADLLWSRVNIPSNGTYGYWTLADGSDLACLTRAEDGTLYCYANPGSTPYRLFKSEDGGCHWAFCGRVEDSIVDIAVCPHHTEAVYYATASAIFRSADKGLTFNRLCDVPQIAGSQYLKITSLDVAIAGEKYYLTVAVKDDATGKFGGVFSLGDNNTLSLLDGIEPRDVLKVAFSRPFDTDFEIITVETDEKNTFLTSRNIGNQKQHGIREAKIDNQTVATADLEFYPDNRTPPHGSICSGYLALNCANGQGGIYYFSDNITGQKIDMTFLPLPGQPSRGISSLAVYDNGTQSCLLAGSADSTEIFYSQDRGVVWQVCNKPPSGDNITGLSWARDNNSARALAITSGVESAFSVSLDNGSSWAQSGLIDSRITAILDLSVAPLASENATDTDPENELFLLTANIRTALWHSTNGGITWQRILCAGARPLERFERVLVSPNYRHNKRIYVAGARDNIPYLWLSGDGGCLFQAQISRDPQTGKAVNIDCWTISPEDCLFVASLQDSQTLIYRTAPGALMFIDKGAAGQQVINSLTLSPQFSHDHTLLAGNIVGRVYLSTDDGRVFEPIPDNESEPRFNGNVVVAIDTGFESNKTIYASADTPGCPVYRFVIGQSHDWEPLNNDPSDKNVHCQLAVGSKGVLYCLDQGPVNLEHNQGGLKRCLNPTEQTPVTENMASGLENGVSLKGLWVHGKAIWTIEATHSWLLSLTDKLTETIRLVWPYQEAHGMEEDNVSLKWEPEEGALSYQWQIDGDGFFQTGCREGETDSLVWPATNLNKDNIYYWRVRACQPVLGPWSETRQFDTYSVSIPNLNQPGTGTTVSVLPVLRWSVCNGADGYELQIAEAADFNTLTVNYACQPTLWQCTTSLTYDKLYYWKVRARRGPAFSAWSSVGFFTTQPADPEPSLESPKLSSPVTSSSEDIAPVFRWSVVDGASQYQLALSRSDNFSHLLFDQVCYANTWKSTVQLDYSTVYYWKVRAASDQLTSNWSSVGVFATRAAPVGGSNFGSGGGSSKLSTTTASSSLTSPSPSTSPSSASVPPTSTSPMTSNSTTSGTKTTSPVITGPSPTFMPSITPDKTQSATPTSTGRVTSTGLTNSVIPATTRVEKDDSPGGFSLTVVIIIGALATLAVALVIMLVWAQAKKKN